MNRKERETFLCLTSFIMLSMLCLTFYRVIPEEDPYRILDSIHLTGFIIPFMYISFYGVVQYYPETFAISMTVLIPTCVLYNSVVFFAHQLDILSKK